MSGRPTSARAWAALAVLVAGYAMFVLVASGPSDPLRPPSPMGVEVPSLFEVSSRWLSIGRLEWSGLTFAGILLLLAVGVAFAVLCWESWNRRVSVLPLIAASLVSLAFLTAAPLLLSRDVYSYASYGRIYAVHHSNPYVESPSRFPDDPFTPVVSAEWKTTPSVYGPAFTLLSAGIGRVTRSSTTATVFGFKTLAGLAMAAATFLSVAVVRRLRPDRTAFAVAVVGLNPVILIHVVGGGHNDALVAALLATALWVIVRSSTRAEETRAHDSAPRVDPLGLSAFSVTLLLSVATLIKVVAAIPLILWFAHLVRTTVSRKSRVVAISHVGVATITAAVFTAPVYAGWGTFKAIANLASRQGWASGPRFLARVVQALTPASLDGAIATAVFVVFFAAFGALTVRLFRARSDQLADTWGGGLLLFALAAPYLLPWYAAWFLPFVPLMTDAGLMVIALAVSGLLALTGVPAEPATDPALWRQMMLAVHYGVAPVMLGLFAWAGIRVKRMRMASHS